VLLVRIAGDDLLTALTTIGHMAAVALNYFAYNFIKIHTTLRASPAMAA